MSSNGEAVPVSVRRRGETERRRRILHTAKRLSALLGSEFFQALVTNLSGVLGVELAYVAELAGDSRYRTLAVAREGMASDDFDQALQGTADGQTISDGSFAFTKEVLQLFPADSVLADFGAEGYAGVRLSDSSGQLLGVLAIASRKPLPDVQLTRSVLEIFAPQAAAEIERKRDDDRHRENEERYQAFIASNPDAMWRVEFDSPVSLTAPEDEQIEQIYRFGYLAECNDALARRFGRSRAEEMLGMPLETFVPRSDAVAGDDLRSVIRSKFRTAMVEQLVVEENGARRYLLRSLFGIVEKDALRRLWGNTRDITDLRRAELSAASSERRFRQVLESILLPAFMLDKHGAIIFSNASFRELMERSVAELSAASWLNGLVPSEEMARWQFAMSCAEGESHLHFEGVVLPRNEAPHNVLWDTVCLRDDEGQVAAVAAVGRDLTYERALEAEIRRAQKLDGIGRLAAGIAHDFNNLLMIVMGNATDLLARSNESDQAYNSLQQIVHAAVLCGKLTGHLLAFGREQPLKRQVTDLNDLIVDNEILISSIFAPGVTFVTNLAPELPPVLVDPVQIQQIFVNLASNARDAMPDGGLFSLHTAVIEVAEDDARYPGIRPGNYVQLWADDTGVGISEEAMGRIFEPFFTTKRDRKGSGLGLSTVYGVVRQSGGHITVRSEIGVGTRFEILLPVSCPVG
jgi:two-component system cell cycle sensor histidine kinase/response regulator CckA